MRRLCSQIAKASPHDLSVLVMGETGTGKELVAQAIHVASRRTVGPMVVVDRTTISPTLAESVLFGHENGTSSWGAGRTLSPFLTAQGGTIFFDEFGELPFEIQPKLLRALETHYMPMTSRAGPVDRHMHVGLTAPT